MRSAWRVPNSTRDAAKLSITFDMMTIGKMLMLSSGPTPRVAPTSVSPPITAATSAIRMARRATAWRRRCWRARRSATPSPTMATKMSVPHQSPVVMKASETMTGPNMPKVSSPITTRATTTSEAMMGRIRIKVSAPSGTCARTARAQASMSGRRQDGTRRPTSPSTIASMFQRRASSAMGVPSIRLARAISHRGSRSAACGTSTTSPGVTRCRSSAPSMSAAERRIAPAITIRLSSRAAHDRTARALDAHAFLPLLALLDGAARALPHREAVLEPGAARVDDERQVAAVERQVAVGERGEEAARRIERHPVGAGPRLDPRVGGALLALVGEPEAAHQARRDADDAQEGDQRARPPEARAAARREHALGVLRSRRVAGRLEGGDVLVEEPDRLV